LKGIPIRLDNGSTGIGILDAGEYVLVKFENYLMAEKQYLTGLPFQRKFTMRLGFLA
jgi:hypothetical protein